MVKKDKQIKELTITQHRNNIIRLFSKFESMCETTFNDNEYVLLLNQQLLRDGYNAVNHINSILNKMVN